MHTIEKVHKQKYIAPSIILLIGAFVVITLVPLEGVFETNTDKNQTGVEFQGMATLTKYDADDNLVFTQTVHNQLLDAGEVFMLKGIFNDSSADVGDGAQIGSICIVATITVTESLTAATFDASDGITAGNNCKQAGVAISGSVVTMGPVTFAEGSGGNIQTDGTISGIGICQGVAADNDDFADCTTAGILFAAVDTTDVTLANGETVKITYTFDMSSPSS